MLGACLAVVGCGSSTQTTSTATRSTPARTAAVTTTPPGPPASCATVARPAPKPTPHLGRPSITLDPAKTYLVRIKTNCGTFTIRLDVARAPKTTASFWALAKRGFYDHLTFHRVAQDFVVQGGDPTGTGNGGPGYTVVEPPPKSETYPRGTVAMAKTGGQPSGASGSQFFVVTAPDARTSAGLAPDYALVGTVVQGMHAIGLLERNPTQPPGDGVPQEPLVMERVTAVER
jgi:peptidyl-prolyl cis-trans isomerase B (cyclophilin B)